MKSFLFCFWHLLIRFSLDSFQNKKTRIQFIFYRVLCWYTLYDMAMTSRYSNLFFIYLFFHFQGSLQTGCIPRDTSGHTRTTIIIYYNNITILKSGSLTSSASPPPQTRGFTSYYVHGYTTRSVGPNVSKTQFPLCSTHTSTHSSLGNNHKQNLVKYCFFFSNIIPYNYVRNRNLDAETCLEVVILRATVPIILFTAILYILYRFPRACVCARRGRVRPGVKLPNKTFYYQGL